MENLVPVAIIANCRFTIGERNSSRRTLGQDGHRLSLSGDPLIVEICPTIVRNSCWQSKDSPPAVWQVITTSRSPGDSSKLLRIASSILSVLRCGESKASAIVEVSDTDDDRKP